MSSGLDFHQERRHHPPTLLPSFDCTFTFVRYGRLHRLHRHQLQGVPTFFCNRRTRRARRHSHPSTNLCRLMTRSRAAWWTTALTPCPSRDDDTRPFILSNRSVSFHSYKPAMSNTVSPPVAVSDKWDLRFDLRGILHRNMYKRAHDDHPHHSLSFIGVPISSPIGLVVRFLHHLTLIFTDGPLSTPLPSFIPASSSWRGPWPGVIAACEIACT